jgi:hypothetical protein
MAAGAGTARHGGGGAAGWGKGGWRLGQVGARAQNWI